LLPGDSIENVISFYSKMIQDSRVKIEVDQAAGGWEASQVSSTDTPAYRSLELVIRQIFKNVPTAPFIFLAATDSRYYQPICSNIFKFSPHILTPEEQSRVHGIDERISQESLSQMAAFYFRLVQVWGDAGF
jgi:carboxypeptidase PM20D1